MLSYNFDKKKRTPICVALGFFDGVHLGHKKVIENCINLSKKLGTKTAVFTFNNNPHEFLKSRERLIYTIKERKKIFEKLGVDIVIEKKFDADFMNLSYIDFFNTLTTNFNVKGISIGSDYTFGRLGKGTSIKLDYLCEDNGIPFVEEKCLIHGKKWYSSTFIRRYIKLGEIDRANEIMPFDYSISGKVVHCNGVGTDLGFPTANIMLGKDKLPLKEGVYSSYIEYEGNTYKCLTNVGGRPTFNENVYKIEVYILDFNKNIYGEELTVYFKKKIRDIVKFENEKELIEQINKDLLEI